MKIEIGPPNSPYTASIDTEVMETEIREVFSGVTFISPYGEKLTVSMRDGGYELQYENKFNIRLVNGRLEHSHI